jgi:hypothetical protein
MWEDLGMSGGDSLFEVDPVAMARPPPAPGAQANKTFRVFAPDQMLLLPPSLEEWLPEGHSDTLNYTTMLDQCAANTGIHPHQALLDAGYCS